MNDTPVQAHYPYPAPIDAYGNGGFRFADMSHKGPILCLPSGIYGWTVYDGQQLNVNDFAAVFAEAEAIQFLLLGTGVTQIFPSSEIRAKFDSSGLGLDSMNTGAACRTYNVLLAEKRAVAAALIPVE
ncbi:MAG: Mth938-like domain-containing protein [Methyloligellaceae bacterium]